MVLWMSGRPKHYSTIGSQHRDVISKTSTGAVVANTHRIESRVSPGSDHTLLLLGCGRPLNDLKVFQRFREVIRESLPQHTSLFLVIIASKPQTQPLVQSLVRQGLVIQNTCSETLVGCGSCANSLSLLFVSFANWLV